MLRLSGWFIYRRRICWSPHGVKPDDIWRRVEDFLQSMRVLEWRRLGEYAVSFSGPITMSVRWDVPRPLVRVTLSLRRAQDAMRLDCEADYGVYGWFGVACFLLLFGPIVVGSATDASTKGLLVLLYVGLPLSSFWVNVVLFIRSLRRVVSTADAGSRQGQ